jgi:hypothetical protein
MGAFGLRQPDGLIWYRYVLVLGPHRPSNSQIVLETVLLISYILDEFGGIIEPVAAAETALP